jgi:hypothetical protein
MIADDISSAVFFQRRFLSSSRCRIFHAFCFAAFSRFFDISVRFASRYHADHFHFFIDF